MKDQAKDDYIGNCELIAHTLNKPRPPPSTQTILVRE